MHQPSERRTARIARHHDHGGGAPTGRLSKGHGQTARERYPNFMRAVGADPLSQELRAIHQALWGGGKTGPAIQLKPLSFDDRTGNVLRPSTFDTMIGQDRLKRLMARIVANAQTSGRPLGHIMLAGQSGTGKTTLAQVIAHECGRTVYQIKAPVDLATLATLRTTCADGDVVIVDEVHQQVTADRRGVTQAADPEDFYHVMEDRRLPTQNGMLPFPAVTFMGCTTDIGLLPEAFVNRFPLTLTLDPYTAADMTALAHLNGKQLGIRMTAEAEAIFGLASRRNPRQTNTYVKNAEMLGSDPVTSVDAEAVVCELNGNTLDGLTPGMQKMLKVLLRSKRTRRADNEVIYQASINTIATALGHSRDTKAVALFVEPFLIEEGYVCVAHGGRQLTDAGIKRAMQL